MRLIAQTVQFIRHRALYDDYNLTVPHSPPPSFPAAAIVTASCLTFSKQRLTNAATLLPLLEIQSYIMFSLYFNNGVNLYLETPCSQTLCSGTLNIKAPSIIAYILSTTHSNTPCQHIRSMLYTHPSLLLPVQILCQYCLTTHWSTFRPIGEDCMTRQPVMTLTVLEHPHLLHNPPQAYHISRLCVVQN